MGQNRRILQSAAQIVALLVLIFSPAPQAASGAAVPGDFHQYIPLVRRDTGQVTPTINAPYFSGAVDFNQTGIFWFGKVNTSSNYTDVRVGYNNSGLWVFVASFDRRLWYKQDPSPADLPQWDSATLYIARDRNAQALAGSAYRIDAELNQWEPRGSGDYHAAYQGSPGGWVLAPLALTTTSGWSGVPVPNDDLDDFGWSMKFEIPFTSLGLSGPPASGSEWGFAVTVHDRDSQAGPPQPDQSWPVSLSSTSPATWNMVRFGLPQYPVPGNIPESGSVTIRSGLNGAYTPDGMLGGSYDCGAGLDLWTAWGSKNYNGSQQVAVQNEIDISDWRCFAKYYITFPLDQVPPGKVIRSAELTLHSNGDAAGIPPNVHPTTLVEVATVSQDWSESTLTWNNAPLPDENVSRAWVKPVLSWPGWPGVPTSWDLGYAVQKAYIAGRPLRLAIYTPSGDYGSGRYFFSADAGDAGRPALKITWGNP